MGTADIIPGVSGGTMAFILGIYERLIEAVRSFDWYWLRGLLKLDLKTIFGHPHFGFIIPLAMGIGLALLFFTRVVPLPYLLVHYPEPVYGLFFGLIAGSIIILLKLFRHDPLSWMILVITTVLGWWLFNAVPAQTPETGWFVFLSGALAISAMLVPGVSGSFILLILNKYAYIVAAVGALNFSIIVPFMLGMLTGLVLFSRIMSWLLHHYYKQAIAAILGLLIASLWVIWPFQATVGGTGDSRTGTVSTMPVLPETLSMSLWLTAGLIVIGFFGVLLLHWLASRRTI